MPAARARSSGSSKRPDGSGSGIGAAREKAKALSSPRLSMSPGIEKFQDGKFRIMSDNGPRFIAKDLNVEDPTGV